MKAIITVMTAMILTADIRGEALVPFVIPVTSPADATLSFSNTPIRPNSPRLRVRAGHFIAGPERVRIWGVNLCFGACFPTRADAPRVAARLAAAGVNSVRFHHMDSSPFPHGLLEPDRPLALSREALVRLDFFIAELARQGIYANLNLHVGRTASRALKLPDPGTPYDKIADLFTPVLIEAQKQYARDLLGHLNPFRGLTYATDPAVAFVEINNEDSFFMWDGPARLPALPDEYLAILESKYVAWLKNAYGSNRTLRRAWSVGQEPPGNNLLDTAQLPDRSDRARVGWRLETHEGATAELQTNDNTRLRIRITQISGTPWHIQVKQAPVPVKKGQYYSLSFRLWAEAPRDITVSLFQDQAPWTNLGCTFTLKVMAGWQTVCQSLTATADEPQARLSFSLGSSTAAVEWAQISLTPGGRIGLRTNESLDQARMPLFVSNETEARLVDRFRFLADTEKAYYDDMKRFLHDELKTSALIIGTSTFGPCSLYALSDMDVIDAHAYWQHPRFPEKPWDPTHWLVEQRAMVDQPESSTFGPLARSRLAGKPFTVSEYNHPAPNDYQAECVPLIASFAALQDWDGIWLFAYSHRTDDWDRESLASFFDLDSNPAKWGFMRSAAALFRQGTVGPLKKRLTVPLVRDRPPLPLLARQEALLNGSIQTGEAPVLCLAAAEFLSARIQSVLVGDRQETGEGHTGESSTVSWQRNPTGQGTWAVAGPGAIVLVTHAAGKQPVTAHGLTLEAPAFAAATLTTLDGKPWAHSAALLLTACGRCENPDMGFSADRRTVGNQWGSAPVRIEPVTGRMSLPDGHWQSYALRPDGTYGTDMPLSTNAQGRTILSFSPEYATMTYLILRQECGGLWRSQSPPSSFK